MQKSTSLAISESGRNLDSVLRNVACFKQETWTLMDSTRFYQASWMKKEREREGEEEGLPSLKILYKTFSSFSFAASYLATCSARI